MRRPRGALAIALVAALLGCGPATQSLPFDRFEQVQVFAPRGEPHEVVLLVSDDGGVDAALEDAARALQRGGALVVLADLARYRHVLAALDPEEAYPGADLEVLGQYVQRELGLRAYRAPVVAGVGAGASVAYAALAEQGRGTFRGGVGVDFCPSLALPKPAGEGTALALGATKPGAPAPILPSPGPAAPFVLVRRDAAPARCDAAALASFAGALPAGSLVDAPARGAALGDALAAGLAALPIAPEHAAATPSALPLIPLPPPGDHSDTLVVILSGDGGWAALVRALAEDLGQRGFGVLGFDSLRYFWTPRTPDVAAADLARAIQQYQDAWGAQRLVLLGYSRGADVLPFVARRLPLTQREQIALVGLIGPGLETSFEFHVTDWLGRGSGDPAELPVHPEVEALRGIRILCIQGEGEEDSLCATLPPDLAERQTLPGGHHFDGDYEALAARVLDAIAQKAP